MCRKWRTKRQILKKSLDKAGVQWQKQPGKKRLVKLLANTYAIRLLLEFLLGAEKAQQKEWRGGGKLKIKMVKIG